MNNTQKTQAAIIMRFTISIILSLFVLCSSVITYAQEPTVNNSIDYTTAKEYEIGGIEIKGTQYLDEKVLISLSGLAVGDKIQIPGEQIPEAIKTLWKQGLFEDVQIYASKIINDIIFLEIHLKELPRMSKYRFSGVRNSEIEELRDALPLLAGRILDANTKSKVTNITKNFYVNKGFLNTKVALSEKRDSLRANSVILFINVDRGRKIKINDIVFEGVENVYPRKLRKSMENTKSKSKIDRKSPKKVWKDLGKSNIISTLANVSISDALNYFDDKVRLKIFSSSKFIKDDYEDDKKRVIEYYNTQGYRDARIVKDSIYTADNGHLNVHIMVDEGQRYHFGKIDWVGNTKHDDATLSKILGIEKGEVYNTQLLEQRLFGDPTGTDVSSLYMDDGYLFFNVQPIEAKVENDTINLEMRVYEGPEATINNIIVEGNDKTNEHVIRRALFTKPGNKFRRSDIIRSQQELVALNYFNPQSIGIQPIPNPADGTVDIKYTVEERPSDQLELSAGWGGRSIVGSLGVTFNNFSIKNMLSREAWRKRGIPAGDGQRLSVRFQATGPRFQALNASFTEPWLGGKRPNALTVAVTRARQAVYPSDFTSLDFFDFSVEPTNLLINNAVSVSLGRRLRWPDDNFTLVNGIRLSHFKLNNWVDRFIVTDGNYYNLSLNTTLSRSTVFNPIFPNSGSTFSLSLELTPPYSAFNNKDYNQLSNNDKYKWTEYHKWKFRAEWFTPITEKLVIRTAAKIGVLGHYNTQIGTAPFERFWIGGDGLSNQINGFLAGTDIFALRGYDENEITRNTVVEDINKDGIDDVIRLGDPFMNKFTMELRYLLSPSPTTTIYALAFLEAGNSWNSLNQYNPFDLYRSAGLGLRIYLPMFGLMGFDWGIGFDRDKRGFTRGEGIGNYLSSFAEFHFILGFEPE